MVRLLLLGEWLCLHVLCDLGCLSRHVWDLALLSQGYLALVLQLVLCALQDFIAQCSKIAETDAVIAHPAINEATLPGMRKVPIGCMRIGF